MDASERRRRASQEAAEWWVRLQEPDASRADREEFIDWLRESALHVAEMLRIAQVHGALEHFEKWTHLSTEGSDEPENENVVALRQSVLKEEPDGEPLLSSSPAEERGAPGETTLKRPSRRGLSFALAASIIGLTLLGAWVFLGLRTQTIATERGERREVALADGSVLEVDPETRLRISFDEHARRVALERGRALFRVAKNPDRPFLVQADGTTVRAVGTAFGVERDGEAVRITVSEGRVAVLPTSSPAVVSRSVQPFLHPSSPIVAPPAGLAEVRHARAGQSLSSKPEIAGETKSADGADLKTGLGERDNYGRVSPGTTTPEIYLTAGQQLTVASTGTAEPVRKVDSDRELAWAKGRLVFDNETLAAAIEEFNRYNRVQLHVVDEALAKRLVSAVFDASDPESFIAFIQTVTPVRITRSDPMNITIAMEVK